MTRSVWAYGLAAIATVVTATSSSTACCSSLLALAMPAESCCHDRDVDTRSAECECCTPDNGQPFATAATAELAPSMVLTAVVDIPLPALTPREPAPFSWWHARPPPESLRTVVLLI